MSNMLVKICFCEIVEFEYQFKYRGLFKDDKQGDGSYLSHENLREAVVGSHSFRVASNLDLEFLEQANVSELKDSFKV